MNVIRHDDITSRPYVPLLRGTRKGAKCSVQLSLRQYLSPIRRAESQKGEQLVGRYTVDPGEPELHLQISATVTDRRYKLGTPRASR